MQFAGVPLNSMLSRIEFRRFDFINKDSYIPMKVMYDFLETVQKSLGTKYIANEFYNDFQLDELGDFGEFITERPDLLTVIQDGIKYESEIQTNTKMKLEVMGSVAKFSQVHLDPMSKGRLIAEDMAFAMAYRAFKMVLGENWRPITLEIPRKNTELISHLISERDTEIVFNSPCYSWCFETKLLSSKNLSMTHVKQPPSVTSSNLSGHILKLLDGLSSGYLPMRSDFSNFLDISESSIVRTLRNEGTSFSSLVENHLFKKTLKLMQDDSLSILEISQLLGYANAPNFVRAFKKWTNTTPDQYRYENRLI